MCLLYRLDIAKVVGYPNYASMMMETKMAGNLDNVFTVLDTLREHAFPAHKREMEKLQEFANKSGFSGKLEESDIPYWIRKQKKSLFNFENEELREYFPYDKVFDGLIKLCEQRFGIRFEHTPSVSTWHPDVKFYYIFEGDSVGPIAGFYLDPFQRPEKLKSDPEGGWIVNIRSLHQLDGTSSLVPLSSVILNLSPPIYGKPSLLSYSEVKSLFGKFGRLLQQLLCSVNYSEVAGLSYVEWDAIEITSHFMKYCLEESEILDSISGHYLSGEKLPVTDMRKVTSHMSGTLLCSELYKSVLDLKLNIETKFWHNLVSELWPQFFVYPLHPEYAEPLSMAEIVTQDSCVAYYSNVWSRMIAADAYSAFNDEGADAVAVGLRFRETYLEFGGGCDPHEIFRRFRGRDPSMDSFLRSLNLKTSDSDNVNKVNN